MAKLITPDVTKEQKTIAFNLIYAIRKGLKPQVKVQEEKEEFQPDEELEEDWRINWVHKELIKSLKEDNNEGLGKDKIKNFRGSKEYGKSIGNKRLVAFEFQDWINFGNHIAKEKRYFKENNTGKALICYLTAQYLAVLEGYSAGIEKAHGYIYSIQSKPYFRKNENNKTAIIIYKQEVAGKILGDPGLCGIVKKLPELEVINDKLKDNSNDSAGEALDDAGLDNIVKDPEEKSEDNSNNSVDVQQSSTSFGPIRQIKAHPKISLAAATLLLTTGLGATLSAYAIIPVLPFLAPAAAGAIAGAIAGLIIVAGVLLLVRSCRPCMQENSEGRERLLSNNSNTLFVRQSSVSDYDQGNNRRYSETTSEYGEGIERSARSHRSNSSNT